MWKGVDGSTQKATHATKGMVAEVAVVVVVVVRVRTYIDSGRPTSHCRTSVPQLPRCPLDATPALRGGAHSIGCGWSPVSSNKARGRCCRTTDHRAPLLIRLTARLESLNYSPGAPPAVPDRAPTLGRGATHLHRPPGNPVQQKWDQRDHVPSVIRHVTRDAVETAMTAIQLRKKEEELEVVRADLKKKEQELRLREQASDKQVTAIAKAEQQRLSEHEQRGKELQHQTVLTEKYKVALHETEAAASVAAFTKDSGLASPDAVLRQASLQSPPREAGAVHQRTPLRGSGNNRPRSRARSTNGDGAAGRAYSAPLSQNLWPSTQGAESIVADGILPNGAFGMVLDDDICDLPMTIPSDGSFIDALFGADSDGGGSSGSE